MPKTTYDFILEYYSKYKMRDYIIHIFNKFILWKKND